MSENDESLKPEKKKGKLGVVVLVIALMALCLGGGFYLGDSGLIKINKKDTESEDKKDTKEEKTDELEDVSVDEFMEMLFDKLETADICGLTKYETFYKQEKVTVGALSKKEVNLVMLNNLRKKGFDFSENNSFSSDDAHDIIKNVFGKDYNYEDESIKDFCPEINYDSQSKNYVVGKSECGGSCGPHTVDKLLSAKRNSDTIELTVGVVFGPKDMDNKFYSDPDRTNVISEDAMNYEVDYSKGTKYKITFKKEDTNYVFVSSEPVK